MVPTARTRGSEHKLEHRRLCLNIRRHSCTVQVTEQWHRQPGEVAEFLSLDSPMKMVLGNLLWVALLEQELDQRDPEVPVNLNHSVTL